MLARWHALAVVLLLCAADAPVLADKDGKNLKVEAADAGTAAPGSRWALLVGVNGYQNLPPLRYCAQDAAAVGQLLVQRGGYRPDHVLVLTDDSPDDRKPTRTHIIAAVRAFVRDQQEADTLLFAFSGHGVRDKDASDFLMPVDALATDPTETGIAVKWLVDRLRESRARDTVIILDACRSVVEGRAGEKGSGFGTEVESLTRGSHIVTLRSCAPDQISYEMGPEDGKQHGVFTYYLLEALGQPGKVTLAAAHNYVSEKVKGWVRWRRKAAPQTPELTLTAAGEVGEIVLMGGTAIIHEEPKASAAILRVASDPPGAEVLVDGVPKGATPCQLSLPAQQETLGTFKVEVRKAGFLPRRFDVQLAAGAEAAKKVKLIPQGGVVEAGQAPREATLVVASDPAGAEVLLGGEVKGKTPCEIALPAGELQTAYTIEIRKEGFKPATSVMKVSGGDRLDPGAIRLVPVPAAQADTANTPDAPAGGAVEIGGEAPARKAVLSVSSDPEGAEVWVDGKQQAARTPCEIELSPGAEAVLCRVELRKPGYRPKKLLPVALAAGTRSRLPLVKMEQLVAVLLVKSEPAGAQVLVNGEVSGQTPLEARLPLAGGAVLCRVELRLDGYKTHEADVALAPDARSDLGTVRLLRLPDVPNPQRISPAPTIAPPPGTAKFETWINPKDGMEFLFVPAGAFQMGSDNGQKDEKPAHTVNLPGYWIGKYEATVGQFRKFMQATGHQPEGNIEEWGKDDRLPVGKASWQDAVAYCRWARVRLPTEAEWERAARGTDGRTYPWGNGWNQRLANTADGGPGRTMGVGGFPGGASPYGCLDIAGNVWEWCSSTYRPYPYRADDGREDPNDSSSHVLRGGGCGFDRGGARVSFRASYSGGGGYDLAGFRCARSEQSLSEPQSERRSVRQQIFIEMAKPNKKPKVQSTHPAARR